MIPTDLINKIHQIEIRTSHRVNDFYAGRYHSAFKGQGMEFQEVRPYVPGDDIRSIDWNVTARMGDPYIKTFTEEREMTVMLLVDISASHQFGSTRQFKKDLAAELAAVLAFSAIKNNDRVGLILFSKDVEFYIPPKKGTSHVLRVIREVLYVEPKHRGTHIESALTFLLRVRRRKAVTFLLSDFFDNNFEHSIRFASKYHDLVAVVIGDKRESTWPAIGLVDWEDAESGKRFLLDTSDPGTRRRLAQIQAQRRTNLSRTFRSAGIDAIHVFAGEPYQSEFIRFFSRREERKRR